MLIKAVARFPLDLHKQKQWVQGFLNQMKFCLEQAEKMDNNDLGRANLLETVNILQNSINEGMEKIALDQAQITAQI